MVQNTRAAQRGVELPFSTVDGGIEFGKQKVAEFLQQRQEEMAQQMNSQPSSQVGFTQVLPSMELEEIEPLNFNVLLEEYENELEKNLELADQAQEMAGLDRLDEFQNREREDDFDLEDELGDNEPSESQTKKRNDKKRSNTKSKSSNSKSNTKSKNKSKVVTVSKSQQKLNRDKAALEKEGAAKRTKVVIKSRNVEIVGKNQLTGENLTKQTEKVANQSIGNPSAENKGSVASKIAEAKLNVQVNNIIQGSAMLTHQTGRSTEFNIGKDVLKFERQGQDTFAMKNGVKIPLEEAQSMLKVLGRSVGNGKMDQLVQITKVAAQNPGIRTLAQNKDAKVQEASKEQVKVIKVQGR